MTRREAITNAAILAGIGLSIPLLSVSLTSCQTEDKNKLDVLSPTQADTIASLAAMILPKGETLGAEDVPMTKLIDVLLRDCANDTNKTNVIAATDYLAIGALNTERLEAIEKQAFGGSKEPAMMGYKTLKKYILFGFFTSETVQESMLNYQPVPGKYDGCVDIVENTKVYMDLNIPMV